MGPLRTLDGWIGGTYAGKAAGANLWVDENQAVLGEVLREMFLEQVAVGSLLNINQSRSDILAPAQSSIRT